MFQKYFLKNEVEIKELIIDEFLALNKNKDEQETKDRILTFSTNNAEDTVLFRK